MATKKTGTRMSNEPEVTISLPVIELALDKIRVDESKNLRRSTVDDESVKELAQSIKERGLLQPIIVRPIGVNGDGCTHELKAGYRRMKALQLNGAEIVKATVLPEVVEGTNTNAIDDKLINLSENRDRKELTLMDQAHAAKELKDAGMQQSEIAKVFGMSAGWTSRLLKLLTLRAPIQQLIDDGKIPFRYASDIANTDDVAEQDKLVKALLDRDKRPEITEEVAKSNKLKKKKKTYKKVKAKASKMAGKLAKKAIKADPRIKLAQKFEGMSLAVVKAHGALADKVKKAKKKAKESDKAMVVVLGALRGYLAGKPLGAFQKLVAKVI